MMAGPDPRRAFVMAGEAHHETHRYFDSARRRIRSWCRCLRKWRGISCPLAYRTISARNAAGHSVGSNDTYGPDFATYERSRTLVASGGRAATPEMNKVSTLLRPTSRVPHLPRWRTRFVAATASWLELARPVPGCSRSMNSSSRRAGSTTRERNALRTQLEWVPPFPVRPLYKSLSRRSAAALPLQGRAACRWPRLRSKPLRSKPPPAETPHALRGA